MASTPPNQSVERAAAVLGALGASENGAMRASDIARAIGLGTSTTGRLLNTLESLEYVRRDAETQGYSVGRAVLELASQGLNHNPVHRESRAAAQELAQRVELTANVGVQDGATCIYLCHFEGRLAPKSHTMIGMRQPLHASALGKCLMLDMTQAERTSLLGAELARYTEHTIIDHDALTADLAEAEARGWCIENQELALGRFCIAAPVRNATGRIAAAISISGRLTVLRTRDMTSLAEDLIEVADRVSVGLGMISAVAR
ncbi:IclR family transcriptional regulator [Curtobacterium pusillum]|uniref:IclR family transcriptional regulator n=1 Tax=Curtobacterium pusillum TaxID=69373 RepID=A0ABX2M5R2_9MICO|nr:IclR family transcriptional regulator [Curtobacterium pusillum]NUU12673.1 IclR family transcriptional regulator [Curtobacterium pusillum]GLK33061.1 IclR family transcriptional regulator [Curtobacterium pusillum]